jgi:HSP20 family protein
MELNFLKEMEGLRREIDDAFKGVGMGRFLEPSFLPGISTARFPQVNLARDADNLYAEVVLPGISAKDLELSVMRNVLTLSGERKSDVQTDRIWHRRERGAGKFMRTIDLPTEVDTNKVAAKFENGLLLVTLPIVEQAKPKKISVKVG